MSSRVTRSTTRAVAALLTPPDAPAATSTKKATNGKVSRPVAPRSHKKGRAKVAKIEHDVNELPHNLGSIPTPDADEDEKPPTKRRRTSKEVSSAGAQDTDKYSNNEVRAPVEVPYAPATPTDDPATTPQEGSSASAKKPKTKKTNNYGLTPGVSPFPEWEHPTPEECSEVTRLLEKEHGKIQSPTVIPTPSLTTSGCGEVPSVLDALIRTRLSAATAGYNSSRAFQGLVKQFGIIKEGIGKGSVDWDAVRRADVKIIFESIKAGGLADVKSKDIKKILQMVYEENQARRDGLASSDTNAPAVLGAAHESTPEKQAEIEKADSGVLSLDHLHAMKHEPDTVMSELTKYPGIGVKTASCVMLFCLQVPSFAVDTHVYRLCRYLNWVPAKANRNSAYSHCEVRIPDELKYPLHQLLIAHGKKCPRCRAATSVSSAGWERGCVIEHLVKRHEAKKNGKAASGNAVPVTKGKGQARAASKKKAKIEEDEESTSEDEESISEGELSDLGSDAHEEASDASDA